MKVTRQLVHWSHLGWTWFLMIGHTHIETDKYWKTKNGALADSKRWIAKLHIVGPIADQETVA
ncbi:MAG: hypothetical protein WC455_17290 [Dehalococcoidia bacterium]